MMWKNLSLAEQIAATQAIASKYNIDERSVEKDWWVTAVLKALFSTKYSEHLLFKGGTSLSKGWSLIHRFSEDIDISINQNFFVEVLGYKFAQAENNTQLRKLRKASRDFVHEMLSNELEASLAGLGISDFTVRNHTKELTEDGWIDISHDSDPTIILVDYKSLFPMAVSDIEPHVKIEISCLSMPEPFEVKRITSLINGMFPDVDEKLSSDIKTATPSRTFIEKILLLNEEFQKESPRSRRMSRHLYDIEKIMDTEYGRAALEDFELYKAIVEHRRKFYHLGYVDYDRDYPKLLSFVPQGKTLEAFRKDYMDNMADGYIYGQAISFEELLDRLKELQDRFHRLG